MKQLQLMQWLELFEIWRLSEASNPGWVRTATEVKGWPDWESWRMFTARQLGLPERAWTLYEFTDPMDEISNLLIGPYTGWQSRLPRLNMMSFADLVNIPAQREEFSVNPAIQKMMKQFPAQTTMTGLRKTEGAIVLIEGHHRATAVALARQAELPVQFFSPVRIAIADLTTADNGLLDRVLARGSSKTPRK